MKRLFLSTVFASLLVPAFAHASPCRFSGKQFAGSPVEQARCLLRTVLPGGVVSSKPAELPEVLASRVGQKVSLSKAALESLLQAKHLSARELGGDLGEPVSRAENGLRAVYFVIHDTSDDLNRSRFPQNFNERSWAGNNLRSRDISEAHVFINRLGDSASGNKYSEPLSATKREIRNEEVEGMFLHHELVQPRIQGKGYRFGAIGPTPGFTDAQYERLALLYVVASVRRGVWMIPAFHCTIDEGIPNGHDDPQNFELSRWGKALESLLQAMKAAS